MEEIEVKIADPAFLELPLEDLFDLAHVGEVVARELGRQIELLAGVFCQRPAHHQLRIAGMVAPGGIVVVDAVGHGAVHHRGGGRFVDFGVVPIHDGQPHGAHPEGGKV